MSEKPNTEGERRELPIEKGYPLEKVNRLAERETRGREHYKPIYTIHKWWARRTGAVFRTVLLYSLLDNPDEVSISSPGEDSSIGDFGGSTSSLDEIIENISRSDPDGLWELYDKNVKISNKKVLDPFAGGGTSLIESSRLGVETTGSDLNPVAWFVNKKEIEASEANIEELKKGYKSVQKQVEDDIKSYYTTNCPNDQHHDADVMYCFWVKELECVSCGNEVPLFNDYRIGKGRYENKGAYNVLCEQCGEIILVDDWRSECMCDHCGHNFVPEEGNIGSGKYSCSECGQKYAITDAISEVGKPDEALYAIEYYCTECDDLGEDRSKFKGYKSPSQEDIDIYEEAEQEWDNSENLNDFAPSISIREGHMTAERNDLFAHGISEWTDMFNKRQLLSLSKLFKAISQVENDDAREYLALAASESLKHNSKMSIYNAGTNAIINIFKSNSFDPPTRPVENNLWGTRNGTGTFSDAWDMVLSGIRWAKAPTDIHITDNGEIERTKEMDSIPPDATVLQGDMRELDFDEEYDAVITDPPYYDNIIYSELSDYFYVWLRQVLSKDYDCFEPTSTPRASSIVANPAEDKGALEFESELKQAFNKINTCLKSDGVLAFTYHHSSSESWGELLEALCDTGFVVTAAYPVTADIQNLSKGESVSFDIIVVARPASNRVPISWNKLRRRIYRTARRVRRDLEENRELSRGDIGVMEMGECFREYSKHHGEVQHDGDVMSAKEVVSKIYGIIQEASQIGAIDVFIDLLDTSNPTYDDVNKLSRGTSATPEELKEKCLYDQSGNFKLGTWENEKRQAYIQERINGNGDNNLSNLAKLQFLRYRYEKGQAVQNYVEKWDVDDDIRDLAGRLADVTGDETYSRVLGDREITNYTNKE